jgi:hypothetical protein
MLIINDCLLKVVSTLPGIFNILNTLRNIIDSPENFVQVEIDKFIFLIVRFRI